MTYLVRHYKVPKNSMHRNGDSELDRFDYIDRTKGDGDGRANCGRTAWFLRKEIAK
jgi:hypothetical protein